MFKKLLICLWAFGLMFCVYITSVQSRPQHASRQIPTTSWISEIVKQLEEGLKA